MSNLLRTRLSRASQTSEEASSSTPEDPFAVGFNAYNDDPVPLHPIETFLINHGPGKVKQLLATPEQRLVIRRSLGQFLKTVVFCLVIAWVGLLGWMFVWQHFHPPAPDPYAWLKDPNLPPLQDRARTKAANFAIRKYDSHVELERPSRELTLSERCSGRLDRHNLTLGYVARAHAELLKRENLNCICAPMYGEHLRLLSVSLKANDGKTDDRFILHMANPNITAPLSSIGRIEWLDKRLSLGSTPTGPKFVNATDEWVELDIKRGNLATEYSEVETWFSLIKDGGGEKCTARAGTRQEDVCIVFTTHPTMLTVSYYQFADISDNDYAQNAVTCEQGLGISGSKAEQRFAGPSAICIEQCMFLMHGGSILDFQSPHQD